jgi:hypothetical protein
MGGTCNKYEGNTNAYNDFLENPNKKSRLREVFVNEKIIITSMVQKQDVCGLDYSSLI